MSRRTGFYGGSPGPPIDERSLTHHVPQLYGQITPGGNHVYGGPGIPYDPPPQEMNGNDSVYYTHHVGGNVMPSNYADFRSVHMNTYPYVPRMGQFYYGGGPAPYYYTAPPQFVDDNFAHGQQYTEWSSNDFSTPNDMSPPESTTVEDNATAAEARSSSNESAGKSRRFSRQRNVKDGDGNRPRSASNKTQFKNVPKHEIRFSHQKRQLDTAPISEQKSVIKIDDNDSAEASNTEDSRFSIIRSIGKREIDTGYDEPQKPNRGPRQNNKKEKPRIIKKKIDKPVVIESSESQLNLLLDQLTCGTYECMVCCDRVKQQHAIWNCSKCYHVFHMGCIKKWARSPSAHVEGEGWRCPGCQNITKKFPSTYNCYCGKVKEPEWNRRETPHSCGEVCGKKRSNNDTCTHPCNILCHPGPCPPCPASVIKPCLCGKMTRKVRCSQQKPLTCTDECGKLKNCDIHKCDVICHAGDCNDCDVLVEQECFCSKNKREVLCGSDQFKITRTKGRKQVYSCEGICEKILLCGHHNCAEVCHEGDCKLCPLRPSAVTTCPCTQTKISDLVDEDGNKAVRTQCIDPIPLCDKTCNKPLRCGGDSIHTCKLKCHTGPCSPCTDDISAIHCRCGKSEDEVPCSEIPEKLYICDRRCNKKRKCGRHKCGKTCCIDTEHLCTQICGRKLECKLHRCEEPCHRGNCHTCYNVSFEDLSCHCGAEVMFAPIPCGTKPPECLRECMRVHSCFHPVKHNCHNEEKCPPCVVLVKKPCNCGRIIRSNIPCHQENVSCGAPCKKVLPCGHHCLKPCHQGPCMEENDKCTQPCSIMRVECIHPCAMFCHQGQPCPPSQCKAMVTLKCSCGNREMQVECSEGGATYQRISSEAFARQQQMSKGTVDISNLFNSGGKQKVLPCNEQCSAIERNRRLAEALNIDEQASAVAEQHIYSSFLQMWAKQDPMFVQGIEQELTNIIEAVAWLDKTKRSHTFPSMRREKRQVIHELAEAFDCKSVSIDEEPNRSVLVTAVRGVSKIPRLLLSDSVKKKEPEPAFRRQTESQSKTSNTVDGKKRLLSSMKLVSLTSASPSSDDKTSDSSHHMKRPASIPRMPSYTSSVAKQSTTSVSGKFSAEHNARGGYSDGKLSNTTPSNSRGNAYRPASYARTSQSTRTPSGSAASGGKNEPEIDYFDMTG
ncbi:transcriptional repressor NF-X1-like [Styela clava]